jgi:hypothetical protein
MIKGKLNWFTRKDILKFDKGFNLQDLDEKKLYDLLEEQMLDMGFILFDNEFTFNKEIVVNGWHERRYSCMVLKGVRRKGRFILKEVGIQFWHII